MSGLVQSIALLRATFDKYAGKDGDKNTLTKAELADLLKNELGIGSVPKDEADKFFNDLDHDQDGVVDFPEYVTFVVALSMLCTEPPK